MSKYNTSKQNFHKIIPPFRDLTIGSVYHIVALFFNALPSENLALLP
ncbi:7415_t:CDS:2 [Gigaspora rosea]|nr:7415_t:CDS:2 [Gigaspora rosea]